MQLSLKNGSPSTFTVRRRLQAFQAHRRVLQARRTNVKLFKFTMVKATRRNSPRQVEKISRPVRDCAKKPGQQAEPSDEKVERKTKYSRVYEQLKETKNKDELNCYKLCPRKDSKAFNMMNLIKMGKFNEKALEESKMVKRVAGRAINCVVISAGVALQWAYAIFALRVRIKSLPDDRVFIRMPTDEELMNGPVQLAKKRMKYWTCRHMEQMEYSGKENVVPQSTMTQQRKAEKKIEGIINAGFHLQTLAAKDSRIRLQISDDVQMFVDSEDEALFKKMTNEMYHEHIVENIVDKTDRFLVAAHRKLDSFSEEFDCKCIKGCTTECPCAVLDRGFHTGTIHDPESIRHYGCSKFCKCEGQCKKAFPKPPAKSTEITFHHQTPKGFALVAKQFFAPGEPVAEMRGEYCRTSAVPTVDNYIIDITRKDIKKIYAAYFKDNSHRVDALSSGYEEALNAVIESGISLNPRNKSSEGRFASSSCLGNTKVNYVHERGVSPTNARVIFTATMPIFPTQEVTWFYSDQYIWEQLREVCLCGELCCVRNVELFPFITDSHLLKFYKTMYQAQLEQFLEKTNFH
ncbi:unnamed protein product [Caenorhabditis nigoni]